MSAFDNSTNSMPPHPASFAALLATDHELDGAELGGRDANERRRAVLARNNVRILGQGPRTLLFCNGFGCNQHIWRYLSGPLAARYRVILFDHVGSGDSDLQAYDLQKYCTLGGYAQDVVEICQVLELEQAILLGHSVGAMIAMLAAIEAPQYFAHTIMLAPSPCYLNKPGYYGGLELADMNQMLALLDADQNSWANLFAGLLTGPQNDISLGEELAIYFCNIDSHVARHFARVTFLSDCRAEVTQLQTQTLVLQCTQDTVAPTEVGDFMLANLPHAKLVTLRATGHCPHLSAPSETLAAIESFLAAA